MAYTPPTGDAVTFDFVAPGYVAPAGDAVAFDFGSGATPVVVTPGPASIRIIPGAIIIPILPGPRILRLVEISPVVNLPQHVQVPRGLISIVLESPPVRADTGIVGGLSLGVEPLAPARLGASTTSSASIIQVVEMAPTIRGGRAVWPGIAIVRVEGVSPAAAMRLAPTLGVILRLSTRPASWVWAADTAIAQVVYEFLLTGSAGDIALPASSIQGRLRDGAPTYLSVVVPSIDYAPDVSARTDGEMIVNRGYRRNDGITTWQEIARATLDSLRIDQGARSSSITLTGYATTSNDAPKTVALAGASYRNVGADGKRRYRCAIDMFLRPGDTATINGETIIVGSISYTIGVRTETMEIVEA